MSRKKKTVLSMWIISYAGVALLLTAVILCVSGLYGSALKKEIEGYNNVVFRAISENISQKIYDIDEIKNDIASEEYTAILSRIDTVGECYDDTQILELISYMKEISVKNSVHVFVYLKKADCVISEHGILTPENFYNVYLLRQDGGYEGWYQSASSEDSLDGNEFFCINDEKEFKAIGKQFWENGVFYSIAADKDNFLSEISLEDFEKRYKIAIYSDTGKMIFSTTTQKNVFPQKLSALDSYANENFYTDRAIIKFPDMHKTSVMIAENNAVKEKMHDTVMCVLLIVLAGLLLCLIVVWKVISHNYKSVQKIKDLLDISSGQEFEEIEKKVLSIKEENISARNYLNKRMTEQQRATVDALLHLKNTSDDMKNELLKKAYFCVICFKLADMDEFFKEEKNILQKQFHLNLIIENIFAELFGEINVDLYSSYRDNEVVCLLNLDESNSAVRQKTDEILSYGVDIIDTEFGISLIYAVSDIYDRENSVSGAYDETKELVEGMIMLGMRPQSAQNGSLAVKDIFCLSAEKQKRLIACLQACDKQNAMSIINEMLDMAIERRYSKKHIKVMLYDIISVILKSNIFNECDDDFSEQCISMLLNLDENYTLEKIRLKIDEIVRLLCDLRENTQRQGSIVDKQQKRVLDMIFYIKKNYSSKEINVSSVAYEFHLSRNYASKLFKEYVHKSMLDYINELRVEKADELLAEGLYTATEISDMVGFNYVKTFYRVYKGLRGTTPGQNQK